MDKNSLEDILDAMKSFVVFENQLIAIFLLFGVLLFMPFLRSTVIDLIGFITYAIPESASDIFIEFNKVYYSFLKVSFLILMFLWMPRYLLIFAFLIDMFMSKYITLQKSFSLINHFQKLLDRTAFITSNLLLIIMLTRTVFNLGTIIDFIYNLNHPLAINIVFPIFLYVTGSVSEVCQD